MIVYLVTQTCSDTYYADHPTKVAFITREMAKEFIESKDDFEWPSYNIFELNIVDSIEAAEKYWR